MIIIQLIIGILLMVVTSANYNSKESSCNCVCRSSFMDAAYSQKQLCQIVSRFEAELLTVKQEIERRIEHIKHLTDLKEAVAIQEDSIKILQKQVGKLSATKNGDGVLGSVTPMQRDSGNDIRITEFMDNVSTIMTKVEEIENSTTNLQHELESERRVRRHLEEDLNEARFKIKIVDDKFLNITLPMENRLTEMQESVFSKLESMNKTLLENQLKLLYEKVDRVVHKNEAKKIAERLDDIERELMDKNNISRTFKIVEKLNNVTETLGIQNQNISDKLNAKEYRLITLEKSITKLDEIKNSHSEMISKINYLETLQIWNSNNLTLKLDEARKNFTTILSNMNETTMKMLSEEKTRLILLESNITKLDEIENSHSELISKINYLETLQNRNSNNLTLKLDEARKNLTGILSNMNETTMKMLNEEKARLILLERYITKLDEIEHSQSEMNSKINDLKNLQNRNGYNLTLQLDEARKNLTGILRDMNETTMKMLSEEKTRLILLEGNFTKLEELKKIQDQVKSLEKKNSKLNELEHSLSETITKLYELEKFQNQSNINLSLKYDEKLNKQVRNISNKYETVKKQLNDEKNQRILQERKISKLDELEHSQAETVAKMHELENMQNRTIGDLVLKFEEKLNKHARNISHRYDTIKKQLNDEKNQRILLERKISKLDELEHSQGETIAKMHELENMQNRSIGDFVLKFEEKLNKHGRNISYRYDTITKQLNEENNQRILLERKISKLDELEQSQAEIISKMYELENLQNQNNINWSLKFDEKLNKHVRNISTRYEIIRKKLNEESQKRILLQIKISKLDELEQSQAEISSKIYELENLQNQNNINLELKIDEERVIISKTNETIMKILNEQKQQKAEERYQLYSPRVQASKLDDLEKAQNEMIKRIDESENLRNQMKQLLNRSVDMQTRTFDLCMNLQDIRSKTCPSSKKASINSSELLELCSSGSDQCIEADCPSDKVIETVKDEASSDQMNRRKRDVCENFDYVWRVTPGKITQTHGFHNISFRINKVHKEGLERKSLLEGKTRNMLISDKCGQPRTGFAYLIMGNDKGKIINERGKIGHSYLLDQTAIVHIWQSVRTPTDEISRRSLLYVMRILDEKGCS